MKQKKRIFCELFIEKRGNRKKNTEEAFYLYVLFDFKWKKLPIVIL